MEPESITHVLWRRARSGDTAAYEQLFSLHADRLLVFIRLRIGPLKDRVEAEDVLQDACLSAHRSFEDFDYTDEGAFLRWMCQIVDNRLRDTHDYFTAQKRQVQDVPRTPLTGPVTAMQRSENRERIEQAMTRLSDDHRQVLLLRYFQGLSAEESAVRMNRTPGAIRNLTARALSELGRHMGSSPSSST